MKTTAINIRVPEDFRSDLEKKASDSETTMSDYARNVLWDDLYVTEEEDNYQTNDVPFSETFEYNYLITWLFAKYIYPVEQNQKSVIQDYKSLLEEANLDDTLSIKLKYEFSKVINDINRFLNEPDYIGKQYLFPISNQPESFDYNILMNEVWARYHK